MSNGSNLHFCRTFHDLNCFFLFVDAQEVSHTLTLWNSSTKAAFSESRWNVSSLEKSTIVLDVTQHLSSVVGIDYISAFYIQSHRHHSVTVLCIPLYFTLYMLWSSSCCKEFLGVKTQPLPNWGKVTWYIARVLYQLCRIRSRSPCEHTDVTL